MAKCNQLTLLPFKGLTAVMCKRFFSLQGQMNDIIESRLHAVTIVLILQLQQSISVLYGFIMVGEFINPFKPSDVK